MRRLPAGPARHRDRDQLQRLAGIRADDAFGIDLVPERLCSAVVEHEVAVVQDPRNSELGDLAAHDPADADGRAAQRAPGDRNRNARDRVVDDLVAIQDARRVGALVAAEGNCDNHGIVGDMIGFGCGHVLRIIDGWNAVPRRTALLKVVERDGLPG